MKKILFLIPIAAAAALLGVAATKPDTFTVARSTTIQAPPEQIRANIDDFHRWQAWSPFEKLDPRMQRTHGGAARGRGAVYAWRGNAKAGAGRMEIVDVTPSRVTIDLHFLKPFDTRNVAEFTLEPAGGATRVTWTMRGRNLFIGKVLSIFVDMDDMIGRDFESGLANLKTISES
ncbi:MAG TPA: SRPBCC family protein [Thermoanaerobaculia bacterium]|jgi:hypothetical protein|nr:SRPBCC family protein [Thermoanaerobaculia bacterium]